MRTTAFYSAAAEETFSPPATVHPSPWNSPVLYLFGVVAAMLGLIAFALLLLACSFLNLNRDREGGAANKSSGDSDVKAATVFEEKVLVIMAGDVKPTFLATPTSGRANEEKILIKESENGESKSQPNLIITEE